MVILISVVGTVGVISLKTTASNSEKMYSNNLQSNYKLTNTKLNLLEIRADMLKLAYEKDISQKSTIEKDIQICKNNDDNLIESYEKLPMNDVEMKMWTIFKNQLKQFTTDSDNAIKLVDDNNFDEANNELVNKITPERTTICK